MNDGLEAGAIDGVEGKNLILAVRRPLNVSQYRVDACAGIGDDNDGGKGSIEKFGKGRARFVEKGRIGIADEEIGLGFGLFLEFSHLVADGERISPKGAMIHVLPLWIEKELGAYLLSSQGNWLVARGFNGT